MIHEDLSEGNAVFKIPVTNTIDGEDLPIKFSYIEENLDRPMGPKYLDHKIDLTSEFPDFYEHILYECNEHTCKGCLGKCEWCLTPPRFDIKCELYKTPKSGFAVRSHQFIEAGRFIAQFAGEVVDHQNQEHRPLEYAYEIMGNGGETLYIDPYRYGNISRFFNHSCFPNMESFRFFSSHRDESRPCIGFFASRDILPIDEMTIEYGVKWWEEMQGKFHCTCDWVNCMNPAPGKFQMSADDASKLAREVMIEKHMKLVGWKKGVKNYGNWSEE